MCIICRGILQKLLEHELVAKVQVERYAAEVEEELAAKLLEFKTSTHNLTQTEQDQILRYMGKYNA